MLSLKKFLNVHLIIQWFYDFIQNNKKIINTMYWILDTPKSASVHPCGTLSIPANESIFEDFPLIEQDGEYMCEDRARIR